jgi:hypothetical protein
MKWGGYRSFLICLIFLVAVSCPVYADAVQAVKTHVFFQKNGLPYNESVKYVFKCYGTLKYPSQSGNISEIYEYSATCSGYGCGIWQPDTHDWNYNFDHCDLEGKSLDREFTIHNIPIFSSCERFPNPTFYPAQMNKSSWISEEYYATPETLACLYQLYGSYNRIEKVAYKTCNSLNESGCMELFSCIPPIKVISRTEIQLNQSIRKDNTTEYIRYLETCDPSSDSNCPGWIINGKPLKQIKECLINSEALQKEYDQCREFYGKVNPALILPEEEFKTRKYGAPIVLNICDTRWTIPSDNQTLQESSNLPRNAYIPQSPVESLYCSIVQILGGRCE